MAMSSEISVGLAHELVITACKAGFEAKDLATLAKNEGTFHDVLNYLRGELRMINVEHCIDGDNNPPLPYFREGDEDRYQLLNHTKTGPFVWSPHKIELYNGLLNESGHLKKPLGQSLKRKKPLGANVAFFLNKRPWLVPEEWRKMGGAEPITIYFYGTQYSDYQLFRGKKVPGVLGLVLHPTRTYLTYDNPDKYFRDPRYHYAAVLAE